MLHLKKNRLLSCSAILLCFGLLSCNNDASVEAHDPNDSTARPVVDTTASIDTTMIHGVDTAVIHTVDTITKEHGPKASIAYAYKNKMKKGEVSLIQMHVQLSKPLADVESGLKKELKEEEAIQEGSTDTSVIKSLSISGAKYFHVSINYDTAVFFIESVDGTD